MSIPEQIIRYMHCFDFTVYKVSHLVPVLMFFVANKQEYPSDPLRKISALQTKVELAGNVNIKQNLAENLAYRELQL